MATPALVRLSVGLTCLEEWGGTGEVLEEICLDGFCGLCGEAEGPGLLQPGEVDTHNITVGVCNCLKRSFRDHGAFLGSGKRRKPPQSEAWKVHTGWGEKETSLKM